MGSQDNIYPIIWCHWSIWKHPPKGMVTAEEPLLLYPNSPSLLVWSLPLYQQLFHTCTPSPYPILQLVFPSPSTPSHNRKNEHSGGHQPLLLSLLFAFHGPDSSPFYHMHLVLDGCYAADDLDVYNKGWEQTRNLKTRTDDQLRDRLTDRPAQVYISLHTAWILTICEWLTPLCDD